MPEDQLERFWPKTYETRFCHSAPPVALCSPTPGRSRQPQSQATMFSSLGFNLAISPAEDSVDSAHEPLANYVSVIASADGQPASNELDYNSLFEDDQQELQCKHCDRKFRKPSDLHNHRQTHLIEQHYNSRSRTYQCPECKVFHRSRAHLEKHILEQHDSLIISGKSFMLNCCRVIIRSF